MSDNTEVLDKIEDVVKDAVDVVESTVAPEVEDKARKMGWTEKESFKGDPDKWRPADEFVERGEQMLPIMKKTAEKQERKIAELEKSIKEFADYHTKTEQRAYERAFKDLKAKQIQAVSEGDTDAFVQIDKEIVELQNDAASTPKPNIDPAYNDWAERNKWVDTDPTMLAFAEAQAIYLKRTKTGATYAELLEEVSKAVKKEFPEKFSNPRRESAPSVESSAPVRKTGGKGFADMPADARGACERMMKNAYGSDPKQAAAFKAEFVKNYDWE